MSQMWALVAAVLSLTAGVGLYVWTVKRPSGISRQIGVIAWLLIAMVPVLVLFTVFPESQISVRFKTISAGGAVALFVWLWWRGTQLAADAASKDKVEQELRKELKEARRQLETLQGQRKRQLIRTFDRYDYRIIGYPDRLIGIVTGDLGDVTGFDIWTNSENTNMRMAGIYERSVSAKIRYEGSEIDEFGDATKDTIMDELRAVMGSRSAVEPHTVLVTGAGRLAKTRRVMRIFHVAASVRQRGSGSQPVYEIEKCVWEALKKANTPELAALGAKSILLPLFGTGQGGRDLTETVKPLIETAIEYLRKEAEVSVREAYFLALFEDELETCRATLQGSKFVRPKQ